MNNENRKLDCLNIGLELIYSKCDWNTKAALAYINFRSNHPTLEWEFCQADFAKQLNLSTSIISRLFKIFVNAGVLKFEREEPAKNGLKRNIYSADKDKYNEFINGSKMQQSRIETVVNNDEPSLIGNVQSQNGTVTVPNRDGNGPVTGTIIMNKKNKLEEREKKNDNRISENVDLNVIGINLSGVSSKLSFQDILKKKATERVQWINNNIKALSLNNDSDYVDVAKYILDHKESFEKITVVYAEKIMDVAKKIPILPPLPEATLAEGGDENFEKYFVKK